MKKQTGGSGHPLRLPGALGRCILAPAVEADDEGLGFDTVRLRSLRRGSIRQLLSNVSRRVTMANQEIVIFVASPGDCQQEREVVWHVAETLNQTLGRTLSVRARVVGWEYVLPDFGRPQSLIDPFVDECDVFIGILNRRLGSNTGTHPSGFVEEFEYALERRVREPSPRIALYFKGVPPDVLDDPGKELSRVIAFQERVREEHLALYDTFSSSEDLGMKLYALISDVLTTQSFDVSTGPTSSADASGDPPPGEDISQDPGSPQDEARAQIEATTRAVAQLALGEDLNDRIDPDRFLLIALGLNVDAGDLPEHVANRLYLRRDDLTLSSMEHDVWLQSIVRDNQRSVSSRVVPGWAVLVGSSQPEEGLVDDDIAELVGGPDGTLSSGAFQLLERLGARPGLLWDGAGAHEERVVQRWASSLEDPKSHRDAIGYMFAMADPADVPLLEEVLAVTEDREVDELRQLLLGDEGPFVSSLVDAIYPPTWKTARVRGIVGSVEDDVLSRLLASQRVPSEIRQEAFVTLADRSALSLENVEAAVSSIDVSAVVTALSGNEAGVSLSDLVDLIGRSELDASRRGDFLDQIRSQVTSLPELVAEFSDPSKSLSAWDALQWIQHEALVGLAREVFDSGGRRATRHFEESSTPTEGVKAFVRGKARIGALRILLSQPKVDEEDRQRARAELDADYRLLRSEAVSLFLPIASPDDVEALLRVLEFTYFAQRREVAEAIVRLGGIAGARSLLEVGESGEQALAASRIACDPATNPDTLEDLLYSPIEGVRIAAIVGFATHSSRDALEQMLQSYPKQRDSYYYNVVAWLDEHLYLIPPGRNPTVDHGQEW